MEVEKGRGEEEGDGGREEEVLETEKVVARQTRALECHGVCLLAAAIVNLPLATSAQSGHRHSDVAVLVSTGKVFPVRHTTRSRAEYFTQDILSFASLDVYIVAHSEKRPAALL